MKSPDEWAWMERDGERCHGPFSTREEAVEDARGYDHDVVMVGRVRRYEGDEHMPSLDDLVEQINEAAYDGDFGWLDDPAFDVADSGLAQAELTAWARRHLHTIYWTITDEQEVVLVETP